MKIDFIGDDDNYLSNDEYILFYADGPDKVSYDSLQKKISYINNIYSDTSFYLLTFNQKEGKRIESNISIEDYLNIIDFSSQTFIYENDLNLCLYESETYRDRLVIILILFTIQFL